MARKKLSVKSGKEKPSLKKKLQTKIDQIKLSDLFDPKKPIFSSGQIITDNYFIAIIIDDSDELISKEIIKSEINTFSINQDDLQIEFNRKNSLEPYQIDDDIYMFESIGSITNDQYNWFKQKFPQCTFHQITKWFGKEVNTLIIVLAEELGKPVGILKTIE